MPGRREVDLGWNSGASPVVPGGGLMMAMIRQSVPIPGTELSPRQGSRVIGRVNHEQRIELTVRLRPTPSGGGSGELEKMVMALGAQKPGERKYLSHAEYEAKFGADASDIAKVRAFAKEQGFDVVAANAASRTVKLAGPLGKLAEAFSVTLNLSKHQDHVYRERTGPVSVPAELAGIVEGVFGFDTRQMAEPQRRTLASRPGALAARKAAPFSPLDVAKLYNFPSGLDGAGQCIGILEFGGGFNADDLTTYFQGIGVPPPKVVAVSVDGVTSSPGTDPDSDGEVMLDIEVAGGVAPGATIAVYFANFTVQGWVDALTQAIHDTTNKPSVISISWGWAEMEPLPGSGKPTTIWTQSAVNTVNQAILAAGALGITVLCAAGDDGSSDGFTDGLDHADFPASSPYLLACGGTKLVGSGGKITSEVVWNETAKQEGATGGGISQLNPVPSYQSGLKLPTSKNPGHFAGRGLPDIAGVADPETGYAILVDGQTQVTGGTSAVAPLWAGLVAVLNQGLKTNVGFFNPLLYQKLGPAKVLHDITSGNNGDFKAGAGWDACTGWETPNGQALLTALQ